MQDRILSVDNILQLPVFSEKEEFHCILLSEMKYILCWIFELNILCMSNSECLFDSDRKGSNKHK